MTDVLRFPKVSICTPTFNRRPFFPALIDCIKRQTYPLDRVEWVIVDDGTDPVQDLVQALPFVKYVIVAAANKGPMPLGRKRNLMHTFCTGDVVVYMDDDDYYPPTRVSHAVDALYQHPEVLWAGSSMMYHYFTSGECAGLYACGPYGDQHATAATFAFRRELLDRQDGQPLYADDEYMAEERVFRERAGPMVQLSPEHTIVVCVHGQNSQNKQHMLENMAQFCMRKVPADEAESRLRELMPDAKARAFYTAGVDAAVAAYAPGDPRHKPGLQREMRRFEEMQALRADVAALKRTLAERDRLIRELMRKLAATREYA